MDGVTNEVPFDASIISDYLSHLEGVNVAGINVMHTNFPCIKPALDVIRNCFDGILGCYPDYGDWDAKTWSADLIEHDFAM